jgi:hypothetical protein
VTDLDPVRRPGEFGFVEADDAAGAEAAVREDEGVTLVLRRERAGDAIEALRGLRR